MKLTIIGAGQMGRGIGTRLVAGGCDIELFDVAGDAAAALADELSAQGPGGATTTEGTLSGDVVVFAIPYDVLLETVSAYSEQLAGKIVVDITNPVDFASFEGLVVPPDSSAAEQVAEVVPPDARVLKAFNTTFGSTLVAGSVGGQELQVLIAGDDHPAKETLGGCVEAGGLQAIDVGPLRRARQLEQLGLLHMSLQEGLGTGYGSAVRFIW